MCTCAVSRLRNPMNGFNKWLYTLAIIKLFNELYDSSSFFFCNDDMKCNLVKFLYY
ncbi:hypothetical protein KFK09_023025 [Dendrobium nobile]|uniref:Uncharacterized protein n=1 Tax=Dendrobium nobile TaxID=94219 RepID=A0A8T3AL51_DENNO|nr:hypothetical protein KFK09_023025 [Dendrobium nobile]